MQNQDNQNPYGSLRTRVNVAILALTLVWACCLFFFNQGKEKAITDLGQIIKDTPVVEVADIDKYCGTGKPVALHLITGSTDDFGRQNAKPGAPAPRPMAFRELKSYIEQSELHYHSKGWQYIGRAPEDLDLYSPDQKICIHLKAKDIDLAFLPVVYWAGFLEPYELQLPKNWVRTANLSVSSERNFKIRALPCNYRVLVLGVVSKGPDGYDISGFDTGYHPQRVIIKIEAGQKYADQPAAMTD